MASGEVSWEDEDDVKEIIADVRDAECEMNWVLFGYGPLGIKKLTVLEAGDGDLEDMTQHLAHDSVVYCFIQVAEKAFAFIQWVPENASVVHKAKATVHRSFIMTFLGSLAFDIVATSLNDITQDKIDEELSYKNATSGRSLNAADAVRKLEEEQKRKDEMAKRQALAGNTHEAQKRLAQHQAAYSRGEASAPTTLKASSLNVAQKQSQASLSHSLFSSSKVAVEFEDEEGLKELCLELRELEEAGDFDWMMLGYAEEKKNTLRLLETGNGGREAIVDYVKEDMGGALDKVLYLVIKEDYSCNKCTFICWIGSKVPAFVKAVTSTHQGAISEWVSRVIHKLQAECVGSGNELLGLKDEDEDSTDRSLEGDRSVAVNDSISVIDDKLSSKPYAGQVLEKVVRDKTPQELWLERKNANKDGGLVGAQGATQAAAPTRTGAGSGTAGGAHQFTQVVLKKNDGARPKAAGRSKWSQKRDLTNDGGESEASNDSALSAAGTGVGSLAEQARVAAEEAAALEREAQRRREHAQELAERAKREQMADVLGEEPNWSPDSMSEAEAEEHVGLAGQGHAGGEMAPSTDAGAEAGADDAARVQRIEAAAAAEVEAAAQAEAKAAQEAAAKAAEEKRIADEAEAAREAEAKAAAEAADKEAEDAKRRAAEEEEESLRKKVEAEAEAAAAEQAAAIAAKNKAAEEAAAAADEERRRQEVEAAARREEEERARKDAEEAAAAQAAAEQERARKDAEEAAAAQAAAEQERARKEAEEAAAAQAAAEENAAKVAAEEAAAAAAAAAKEAEEKQRAQDAEKENEARRRRSSGGNGGVLEEAAKRELDAKEARLAAARKALEDARALSTSLSSQREAASVAEVSKSKLTPADANKPKESSDDDIRRKAEELLARKKALLEEAARKHKSSSASAATSAGVPALAGDAERLWRAEEYRQRKMAELASKKNAGGGSGSSDNAAAKKAAFLKEAEEAVRRAAVAKSERKAQVEV